jgi:hypothetical protein
VTTAQRKIKLSCKAQFTAKHIEFRLFLMQELDAGSRGSVGLAGMQALKPFMSGLIVSDGKHAGA